MNEPRMTQEVETKVQHVLPIFRLYYMCFIWMCLRPEWLRNDPVGARLMSAVVCYVLSRESVGRSSKEARNELTKEVDLATLCFGQRSVKKIHEKVQEKVLEKVDKKVDQLCRSRHPLFWVKVGQKSP